MSKNKVGKALVLLEGLVEQLHYAYGGRYDDFKKHVLKDVSELEGLIRGMGEVKTSTYKRIAKKYEKIRKRSEIIEDVMSDIDDTKLTGSIKKRYRQNITEDSE